MTTEIRDEWLVAMKKDGRANAREVKLIAEELIEMRKKFNEPPCPVSELDLFKTRQNEYMRLEWADWCLERMKKMQVGGELQMLYSEGPGGYSFKIVRTR
jgi:hypothetical protein